MARVGKPSGSPPLDISSAEIEAELARRAALPSELLASAVVGDRRIFGAASLVGTRIAPTRLPVEASFSFPILAWDAWMALHHLVKEPLEFNKNNTLPVRWTKPLEAWLVPLPAWVGVVDPAQGMTEARILPALDVLLELKFVDQRRTSTQRVPTLRVTPSGLERIHGGRVPFFAALLESRRLAHLDPSRDALPPTAKDRIEFALWRHGHHQPRLSGLGRILSHRLLGSLPSKGSATMEACEQAFAPTRPVLRAEGRFNHFAQDPEFPIEEFFERTTTEVATEVFAESLLHPYALGLLARCLLSDGNFGWSLSPAGRTFLGLSPDPRLAPSRHIKVTPAYDIFFGRSDPMALAEIALYAEPTGQDHGVVGHLTRARCQSAFSLGVTSREIIASLQSLVAKPLPQNVEGTIAGWEQGSVPVRIREGVIVQCVDSATLGTLERLAKGAERLSDTVLILPDRKALTALRAKASDLGIPI
jgi:hypothetical protein